MAKLNIKNILKKAETLAVLQALIDELRIALHITDETGKKIFVHGEEEAPCSFPVKADEEIIGFVHGENRASLVARILNELSQKELEKKKLGAEVLNLYQEINLIFNFSEKLAQTIDASSICSTTLEEARHVIASNKGVIVLWNENQKKIQVISSYGDSFFTEAKINDNLSTLLKTILSGQSEIVTDTTSLIEAEIIFPEITSVIYSALKVSSRIMGAIILATSEAVQYTAGHLKLLTTLALQSSAAIESALLYEKNIREAKEREDAMRLVYEATGKFVPYEFIGALGHNVITDVKLGDQVQKI